ncbi:hypothetical protein N0V90_007023 [Kalmusia sp. IMI 367209]|nr:hypothetical protein N0V90_007023 [Kalmusia sp. IMI 367209]
MDIGYDDWSVLATTIISLPSAIVTVYGTVKHGLGQDIWALQPREITEMLKYFYVMAALYFTQTALLKLCLIFFYIRVFPSGRVQRLLWGTVIFVVLWGTTFVLASILQCQPIHYFWQHWDGLHQGHCVNINAITNSHAAISIALDFWILGIPLWQIWGLKMHWKKKLGVVLMFGVGTFVTVVSILRLRALVNFAASSNASWEFYDVSVWSTIEICVGIMCRQKYYNCEDSRELQNIGRSVMSHDVRVATSGSSLTAGSPDLKEEDGIVVETSYTIKHSHNELDEVSLVSHKELRKQCSIMDGREDSSVSGINL